MTNTIIQTITTFLVGFFNELLVIPVKALYAIALEYIYSTDMSFISIIGMFICFVAVSYMCKWLLLGIRAFISHMLFLKKEKKRKEILAIKRKERERTEARLAYENEFNDLYRQYVLPEEQA